MTVLANIWHTQTAHWPQTLYARTKVGHWHVGLVRWPYSILHWTDLYIVIARVDVVVVESIAIWWYGVVFFCRVLGYEWSYCAVVCGRGLVWTAVTYFSIQRYYVRVFVWNVKVKSDLWAILLNKGGEWFFSIVLFQKSINLKML